MQYRFYCFLPIVLFALLFSNIPTVANDNFSTQITQPLKRNSIGNPDIIPSQKSDFFIYGEITRDVWLKVLSPTFIDHIQISTPKVTTKVAETSVLLEVVHQNEKNQTLEIEVTIKNPDGKIVSKNSARAELNSGKNIVSLTLPRAKNPALCSSDQPNLYQMTVQLKSNKIMDEISERFGYRWFEFKEHGAFYLKLNILMNWKKYQTMQTLSYYQQMTLNSAEK